MAGLLHTPQGELVLNSNESTLLHALALAPDHTLEIFQVLERLDKPLDSAGKVQLEVLISRLRSKLVTHGAPAAPFSPCAAKAIDCVCPCALANTRKQCTSPAKC